MVYLFPKNCINTYFTHMLGYLKNHKNFNLYFSLFLYISLYINLTISFGMEGRNISFYYNSAYSIYYHAFETENKLFFCTYFIIEELENSFSIPQYCSCNPTCIVRVTKQNLENQTSKNIYLL